MKLFLIIIYVLNSYPVISQDFPLRKIKILPVPAFGYAPETKTYIGAVTLFTFSLYGDTITRTSNAKFEFNYTWNKQVILESEWNYFFKEERWFTKGRIHYSKFPDLYYGIGTYTPESNKLPFQSNRFVFEAHALKRIGIKLFTGPFIKYINYSNVKYNSDIHSYPELVGASASGVGYSILKDSRNNLLTPAKGIYLNFNIGYTFARNNFGEASSDIRYYKTYKGRYTWANRFINEFNFGHPPFFEYAFLGGDKYVRGYYYGRYRDKHLTSFQSEFRSTLVWRLGIALFGGFSNIYSGFNDFTWKGSKYNYGAGLRFLIDRKDKINLRLDYAIGESGNRGFYISFGESF